MTEQQWGAAPVGGPGAPTPDHPGHTGAPGGVGGVGGSGASSAPGGAGGPGGPGGPGASSGSGPSAGGPGSSGDGRGSVPGGSGGPRASGGPGVSGGPGGPGVPGGPGTSGASGGGPGGGPGGPGGGRGGGSTASGGGRGGGLGGPGGRWSGGTAAGRAWSGRSRSDGPRIERSRQKVVAGVCSGLGRHFGMDPVIFRVPLVVITVIGGLGLLLYGFAWLFLPMEGEEENEARRLLTGRVESTSLGAVLCALAGCGLMVNSLGDSRMMTFALLVTAAVGAAAYWSLNKRGQDPDPTGEPRPEAPPEPMAPPTPAGPSWWREPTTADDYLWGPDGADLGVAGRWTESAAGKEPDTGERCTGGGLSLGTGVFFAALGAGITAATVVWSDQPLGTALVVGLGTALAVFGLGLLVGAFVGRIGGGTIVSVVLTTVLLAGSAALPSDLTTNWSERTWRPAATADVRPDYRVGSGSGTLDLRQLDLAADDTVASTVRVAAGELRVVVPPGAQVEIDLRIGFGGYQLPTSDGTRGGPGAADEQLSGGGLRVRESYSLTPADGDTRRGTIRLKLDLGAGGLVVDRAAQPIEEGR